MNKFSILGKALFEIRNWPLYLADYAKVVKGRATYNLSNGLAYTLRAGTNDRNIFNEVMFHKLYNPPGFEINKGDVVMDIGAHIGMFSLFASQNAAVVYSFEPFPENFALLDYNIRSNKKSNIVAVNKAVSSVAGTRELFIDQDNVGGHSFYQDAQKQKSSITSETITLADIFSLHNIAAVNFLKIDCEGGEYDILFTCPRNILDTISKISMEYHNIDEDRNVAKLEHFLRDSGFQVTILNNIHMLYAKKK